AKNRTTASQTAAAAASLNTAHKRFTTECHLLPALELADEASGQIPETARDILWQQCAEDLLSRAEFPPEVPKDWAQKVTIRANDPLLKELETFARDPERKVHRFSVRADLRQTLHRAIEAHQLDMSHVTERRGSPYTLVCTKNHSSWHAACKKHRADKLL